MSDTPTNGIPYVPENTTDPAAGLNLALDVIDALLSTRVESMALSAPPGSPADGQMWVVKSPGTGAWAGHNNAFARYIATSSSWLFYEAGAQAWLCLNKADGGLYHWGGSAWAQATGLSDAPADGTTYGRNNGAWVPTSTDAVLTVNGISPDSDGNVDVGSGDVQTVNGVGPDSSGDVALAAADIPFDGASSSGLSATNVEDALNELGERPSGGGSTPKIVILRDVKAQNTNGGACTAATWNTRVLNTKVRDDIGTVTLTSNQFTLPAGTYKIRASAPSAQAANNMIRLYNVTDAAATCYGTSEWSNASLTTNSRSFIDDVFTIAASKTFRIDHYTLQNGGGATTCLGIPANAPSVSEIFTIVNLEKIA